MTYEELSAQEAAIDKAIAHITEAEKTDGFEGNVFSLIDASKAWAAIAEAITLHNESVLAIVLANAATDFVNSPSPEAYAKLAKSVEAYSA